MSPILECSQCTLQQFSLAGKIWGTAFAGAIRYAARGKKKDDDAKWLFKFAIKAAATLGAGIPATAGAPAAWAILGPAVDAVLEAVLEPLANKIWKETDWESALRLGIQDVKNKFEMLILEPDCRALSEPVHAFCDGLDLILNAVKNVQEDYAKERKDPSRFRQFALHHDGFRAILGGLFPATWGAVE